MLIPSSPWATAAGEVDAAMRLFTDMLQAHLATTGIGVSAPDGDGGSHPAQ